ncbi:MAG TPA: PA14 domain-containing protein [Tepidisphaeraceae bacterium]|nr:PA14 domain-containing protein [Tepidisphaeraceae bacterium]
MKMHLMGVAAAAVVSCASFAAAGQFSVHSVGEGGTTAITDITQAQSFLATPTGARFNTTSNASVINYKIFDGYAYNDWFANDSTFPNLPTGTTTTDQTGTDNFAIEATGNIIIPAAGAYTFDVNSDDGFYLKIGTNHIQVVNDRLNADTLATYTFPSAGNYAVDLQYYQNTGHGDLEFSAASGSYTTDTSANMKNFHLVGAADGLQLTGTSTPEPGALALIGIGCVGLLKRRRADR